MTANQSVIEERLRRSVAGDREALGDLLVDRRFSSPIDASELRVSVRRATESSSVRWHGWGSRQPKRYMSPERAAGKRDILDHRTDIYSLYLP